MPQRQTCVMMKNALHHRCIIASEGLPSLIVVFQLRKIGRKYKMQVEELQKELDTLKAKQQTQQAAEVSQRARACRHAHVMVRYGIFIFIRQFNVISKNKK